MSGTSEPLAIHGGKPTRAKFIHPRVEIDQITRQRIQDLIEDGCYSDYYGGKIAREFEAEFARYHGGGYAVAVNSGTSALHAAYAALNLAPGDEVIVPAAAYMSVASAVIQEGAVPVVCDIDPVTWTMCPDDFERHITPRTRAVAPVHFWGVPADMERICEIARRHNLHIVEDCAQSHGTTIGDRIVGTFGDLACYSFAPRKHMSTGQGGMVFTRSEKLADSVRSLANKGKGHGWLDYRRLGFSYVLGDFESLLGLDALRKLESEMAARRQAAEIFRQALKGSGLEVAEEASWGKHIYFKVPVMVPEDKVRHRDFMVKALAAENLSVRPPHPPIYTIPWLRDYMLAKGVDCDPASFPVSEAMLPRIFEVESGPALPPEEAERSAQGVLKIWRYVLEHEHQDLH